MAINTYNDNKRAYSINPDGGYTQLSFQFGVDNEVSGSCSLQWQNNYYVFGGNTEEQHVSIVDGNRLDRIATLSFSFEKGGCTVLNQITIVLCFSYNEKKSVSPVKQPTRIIHQAAKQ